MRLTIRNKIFAAQAVSILLTVLLLGGTSYMLMVNALEKAQQEKLACLAHCIAEQINDQTKDLAGALGRIDVDDYHRYYRDLPFAHHLAGFQEFFPVISLLDASGREKIKVVNGSASGDFQLFDDQPLITQARKHPNRTFFSTPAFCRDLGEPVIFAAQARVGYFGDEFQGILLGRIPLRKIAARFSTTEAGGDSVVTVFDDRGRVVFHPSEKYFQKKMQTDEAGRELLQAAAAGRSYQGRVELFGSDGFSASMPITELGWTAVATIPYQAFMAAPHKLQIWTCAIYLFILAAGVGVCLFFARGLTSNIAAINGHIRRVTGGDLSGRIRIESGDELAELANAFNDMTESLTRANAAKESLSDILQSIIDPLVVTDRDRVIRHVNPAALQLFGFRREEMIGQPIGRFFEAGEVFFADYELLRDTPLRGLETQIGTGYGRRVPVLFSCSLTHPDGDDSAEVVSIFKDITERKQAQKEIEQLVHYDSLTSLPSRALLRDRTNHALARARREKTHPALLFLDIDNFKVVNETLGHEAGDRMLQTIARRLEKCLRNSDTIARWGGDEFVILLSSVDTPEDISIVIQKIQDVMAPHCKVDSHEVCGSVSIGVAMYPEDGEHGDTLLKHSDLAMHHAKAAGPGSYRFYSPEMNNRAHERLVLENSLRQALKNGDGLSLHFQQRVEMASGEVCGVEALARWNHPRMGGISPGRFIPLAEETGLILPLGEWILRQACLQAKIWQVNEGRTLQMAVNISGRQLHQPDLIPMINRILRETGVDPAQLEFELTESVLMENAEETIRTLHRIKKIGIKLSVDDFGTGYSSLSYLRRFPIDTLKIDRSFVQDIHTDNHGAAIVKAIIALAQGLNIRVVAEGVETWEQLHFLKELGCHEVQGYLLGRPAAPASFIDITYLPLEMPPQACLQF